ncbi:MAG: hypothetical protein KME09_06350 [Pleurocapsa minor HA4230-MV1]|jgi:hypothetical protein|nr:hypothetical protein [Pleurocapsa minor HA4230-MV1]
MNNLKKILLYVSIPILLLLLIILLVEKRTNKALNDYSMLPDGVKVVDKIVLGRRPRTLSSGLIRAYHQELQDGISRAFRRNAIELVCTNKSEVLLVEKIHIPIGQGPVIDDRPRLWIRDGSVDYNPVLIKNIEVFYGDYFDTVVSNPLSKIETTGIIKALEKSNFTKMSFEAMDGSRLFTNDAKVPEVRRLINNCQS